MAVSFPSSHVSPAMDRTTQWVFSQDLPTDIIVEIGDACFPLHKLVMVPKSGYIRRKVLEAGDATATVRIDLSDLPGGAEAFERTARFCYGVNFEITVYNVAVLRCAAERLEMTEKHGEGGGTSLARRTDDFLEKAALKTLNGAVAVLRSCESLLPLADEIGIVQCCVDAIGLKACNEATFPTRSPAEWWAAEFRVLSSVMFKKILSAMQSRSASTKSLALAITIYTELSLSAAIDRRSHIESIVSLLPPEKSVTLPSDFLCRLLRSAISVSASTAARTDLEHRVSSMLDTVTVSDLLTIALDPAGERMADLDSVRRIIMCFVEREMAGSNGGVFYGGGTVLCSAAVQKVARTVDALVGDIATDEELSISKFVGIAGAVPKSARRFEDDLYRAVDIYLKAHPGLDEIEREKVCSVMDPLKLSYEARLHASQNKRLPLQIVLSALYYDQLKLRSGGGDANNQSAEETRKQVKADASLARENDALRSELAQMRMHILELERSKGSGSRQATGSKKPTFFASVSRKLGKLNPFKNGSKDTSNIRMSDEAGADVAKPRRRRFSIS